MKACALCGRLFPDEGAFCPVDGEPLRAADLVPASNVGADPRLGNVLCQRYQLRRVVADGGMGRVYEALDRCDQRSVAVKVLHPDVASNDVALARFKREFAVSAELPHEHIVDVIEFRPTDDGSYAIVMEFLYGEELRATLKRRNVLPPGRIVRMLSQLAIGLDAAHARRLVHRDLKPDNIFLCQTSDGDNVKILDFGSVRDNTDSASRLTVLGTTIGSPYYMAPEQAQALDTLDHRADVWALAAIVYESITGQVPFRGNNGPSILLEILTGEPIVPSRAAEGKKYRVPRSVDAVLGRAFKKNPNQRTSSVGGLADDLGAAYGLEGRHADWAKTAEDELQRLIDLRFSALLDEESKMPSSNDGFFAGPDAALLHSMPVGPRSGAAPSPDSQASLLPVSEPRPSASTLVPRSRSLGLLTVLVVAVVALLAGVTVTIWFAK